MVVDWSNLQRTWVDAITEAIVVTAAAHPARSLYAGAFWLLYGDHSSILPPAFALNFDGADRSSRWHPPDWQFPSVELVEARMRASYAPLTGLDGDVGTFDVLWERHIDVLASVCREVTAQVRAGALPVAGSSFTSGFFVGIVDFHQDRGDDYLKLSVDARALAGSGILESYPK